MSSYDIRELNVLHCRKRFAGRLAKKECAFEFANRGCNLCLTFLESKDKLTEHRVKCQYVSPLQSEKVPPFTELCLPSIDNKASLNH